MFEQKALKRKIMGVKTQNLGLQQKNNFEKNFLKPEKPESKFLNEWQAEELFHRLKLLRKKEWMIVLQKQRDLLGN